ncbi:glucosaminidase domain-containing protein [Pectinatus brassicae]|uniref:Mannosyl-glycoprotein endo-beta-N-acetylglucosamidase-like domain-containing protein n=1 Tax=Pectinatus brassicae TaxID=862415 RepID=A0A840UJR2_9FIRM|nr:glucosaminidase domain-containing protein [Pectinatus brassicae]MBB5334928.1 hypothetical protein [Pectinatus brassicae]
MFKLKSSTIILLTVVVFILTTTPYSYAARHHDNIDSTKNNTAAGQAHLFSDKIQQILTQYDNKPAAPPVADNDSILGKPLATPEQCVRYLLEVNPNPEISVTPKQLVSYYYKEGSREGVRPDVAFAQALVETGFFRYGGTVTPDQNNYCGLGTTSTIVKGAYFSNSLLGVRAHIQHLLAYASNRQPSEPIVDPRYSLVRSVYRPNTLNTWKDLNGRWAVPGKTYGQNILKIYEAILNS